MAVADTGVELPTESRVWLGYIGLGLSCALGVIALVRLVRFLRCHHFDLREVLR